jgi:hypothetical protein
MNLESIKTLVTSKTARHLLVARKHSPKVLFVAGSIGVVSAAVLACRATLKVNDLLDEHDKTQQDVINEMRGTETIDDAEHAQMSNRLKVRTGINIAKLYLPAVGVGVASIAALTGSHVVLTKRNAGVMAAYAALDRGFKEYRGRVSDEFGAETDRRFATGTEKIVVEEKAADGKTKTTTVDGRNDDTKYIGGSPYSVVFDERSHRWSKEPGANQMFLGVQHTFAMQKFHAQGHLFLNEVHDMLGLPRTKAGAQVGWVYRKDNEPKNGDNYIDFGVFNGDPAWVDAFIDGREKYAVLDFNVDGVILDLI